MERVLDTGGMPTHRERSSASDVQRDRALLRDALPAVLALVVIQVGLGVAVSGSSEGGWSLLWWLLPLLPAAWLGWAQSRSVRRADEFQRVQQLAAMAVGFGVMLMLSLAGGLLAAAGIGGQVRWLQITFIGGLAAWLVSLAVAERGTR